MGADPSKGTPKDGRKKENRTATGSAKPGRPRKPDAEITPSSRVQRRANAKKEGPIVSRAKQRQAKKAGES